MNKKMITQNRKFHEKKYVKEGPIRQKSFTNQPYAFIEQTLLVRGSVSIQ